MSNDKSLSVFYHGQQVGALAEIPDKRIAFQYSDSWIKTGFPISPLSLPLESKVFIPKNNSLDLFHGLFGVFADSLPDSWGELLLDRYLASKGINRDDITILDRLAYVGSAGMGALEYYPDKKMHYHMNQAGLNYDEISNECNRILSSQTTENLDMLYNLGGSSGGTRPKILLNENGRDYIVKFPGKNDPSISGKREYDYSLCAKNCGIHMTETELIPSETCEGYFKTERFDRKNGEKIHSVTFAGLLEVDFRAPSCDYSTFMKLINLMNGNIDDKKQMYRQMCFNVLYHNKDDHTKNFAYTWTKENGWRLAPAYDITYSTTYYGEQTTAVNWKGKDITNDDFINVGKNAGLSEAYCKKTLDEIKNGGEEISKYITEKGFPKRKKTDIQNRISDLKKSMDVKEFLTEQQEEHIKDYSTIPKQNSNDCELSIINQGEYN